MSATNREASQWNLANFVTLVRIVLAPVLGLVLFAFVGPHDSLVRWSAAVLFLATALTDRLDGHLARSRNMVTDLGKILDPIADKLLIGVALCSLSIIGDVWWWVTIVVLARELGITLVRVALLRVEVMAASWGGKIKTALQVVAITLCLLPLWTLPAWVAATAHVLLGAAVAVTIGTGLQYLVSAWWIVRRKRRNG